MPNPQSHSAVDSASQSSDPNETIFDSNTIPGYSTGASNATSSTATTDREQRRKKYVRAASIVGGVSAAALATGGVAHAMWRAAREHQAAQPIGMTVPPGTVAHVPGSGPLDGLM